jgi:dihydroorotate dehydrogenase
MYSILKWFLFKKDPENAHYITFSLIRFLFKIPGAQWCFKKAYSFQDTRLNVTVAGIDFPNRIGLAAGFDKNALLINEFAACGFGFVEIGTVTPLPQEGNPKKRLFRLIYDEAIINRMGFNNDGMEVIAERLKGVKRKCIVGGNIGKNKVTPNENATSDYIKCFHALHDYVDYFVVNVSSPNTPNLRELQEKKPLTDLLKTLMEESKRIHSLKPIFLKIAPDLTNTQLDDIIEIVDETKIAGVIATNTTIYRSGLKTSESQLNEIGMGGLSGKPLANRATEVIRYLYQNSKGAFPIIGVGGIHSASDALEKLQAGATLLQVYTGFIYEGPALIKKINKSILTSFK